MSTMQQGAFNLVSKRVGGRKMSEDMVLLVCCILSFVLGALVCDKIHHVLEKRKVKPKCV